MEAKEETEFNSMKSVQKEACGAESHLVLKNGCSSRSSQLHPACETGWNAVMGPSVKLLQLQTVSWQGDTSSGWGEGWGAGPTGSKTPVAVNPRS